MSKPFKITCSELDRKFHVYTEHGQFVAPAPTAKAHSKANWDNKKITPKALWESVSTEQERTAIKAILEQPGLTKTAAALQLTDLQIELLSEQKPSGRRQSPAEPDDPSL